MYIIDHNNHLIYLKQYSQYENFESTSTIYYVITFYFQKKWYYWISTTPNFDFDSIRIFLHTTRKPKSIYQQIEFISNEYNIDLTPYINMFYEKNLQNSQWSLQHWFDFIQLQYIFTSYNIITSEKDIYHCTLRSNLEEIYKKSSDFF